FPVSGGVQSARADGGGQPAGAAPRSPGTRAASELEQVRFLLPLLAAEAIVLWEPTPEARRRRAARILHRSRVRGLPAAGRWQTRPAARARTTERSRKQTERTGCAWRLLAGVPRASVVNGTRRPWFCGNRNQAGQGMQTAGKLVRWHGSLRFMNMATGSDNQAGIEAALRRARSRWLTSAMVNAGGRWAVLPAGVAALLAIGLALAGVHSLGLLLPLCLLSAGGALLALLLARRAYARPAA